MDDTTSLPPSAVYERAHRLNAAMLALALEREGLSKVSLPQIELLRAASLIELTVVRSLVKADDAARPPEADGTRKVSMVCDDRLVAAIYAFIHFALPPASNPEDKDYLLLKLTDTTHTYFLVSGARELGRESEDAEKVKANFGKLIDATVRAVGADEKQQQDTDQ